ncbi:hypothetical protein Acid345_3539 [Candidatus Koribacter versatilis Ellin345]|uniref:Uncharacterized protein n=1 Tax=Koribacter versatilis (strain Ellin345) TaxID=204669 RepID=Q1IKR0_KORVE|nr:hypothetical protein [Candidatus Koribacter versatilis]ABF42540.1 hypothetical protein Acid345_3539 [Candidatus Koribacter versatilis Ellin345]
MSNVLRMRPKNTVFRTSLLLLFALVSALPMASSVLPTTLKGLTTSAELVVVGKVSRVLKVKGVSIAEFEVSETLKGQRYEKIYYLAQPSWTCDIADAIVGEKSLLFLEHYAFRPPVEVVEEPKAGVVSLDRFSSEFEEPRGFREGVMELTGNTPFFEIHWSGRGRMPIRTVNGRELATLWVGDVALPKDIHTFAGPEPKYSFIRSVALAEIVEFVRTNTKARIVLKLHR